MEFTGWDHPVQRFYRPENQRLTGWDNGKEKGILGH